VTRTHGVLKLTDKANNITKEQTPFYQTNYRIASDIIHHKIGVASKIRFDWTGILPVSYSTLYVSMYHITGAHPFCEHRDSKKQM
jgi:hypothetical protein